VDDQLLAVLLPGEVDIAVDLFGREVAGRDLDELFAGGRDGLYDGPFDRDVRWV
jgi:hypothetical protein